MNPRHEQTLITPVMREIWRPFYAYGAIAAAVAVVGITAAINGSSSAIPVALFVGVLALVLAATRTLIWRLLPGRVSVSFDDSGLFVRRGDDLVRQYPWHEVEQLHLAWGDRWPEWSRWAMFAHVSVLRRGEGGGRVDDGPGILLVQAKDVEHAERNLNAVVQRYLGDRAG